MVKRKYDDSEDDIPLSELIKRKKLISIWEPLRNIDINFNNPNKKYVTGGEIKNYLLNDPILDWFDLYYNKKNIGSSNNSIIINNTANNNTNNTINNTTNNTTNNIDNRSTINNNKLNLSLENQKSILFKNGNIFEKLIFDKLKDKFKDDFIIIAENTRVDFREQKYLETVSHIKKGTPIIAQAVLLNNNNHTGGIADLLVRSDYLNKLVDQPVLNNQEIKIKSNNKNYHYRVVDIKWSTFTICSNGYNIRNDGRMPAYKGQLAIYNTALGEIQGYFPNQTYILAKKWKINDNEYSWNNLLGVIDYNDFDNKYIQKTKDAILWINNLRNNGDTWDIYNPTIPEMYPNMSNKNDAPWSELKLNISNKINELTQVWHVGVQNRIFSHNKQIYKWSDNNCTAENLNVRGSTRPYIINKILDINRSNDKTILPEKIKNNLFNWKEKCSIDFYLDFETINNTLYNEIDIEELIPSDELIFMIGIGYELNNKWNYISFICSDLSLGEEDRIITEFTEYVDKLIEELDYENEFYPRFFHWHNAEISNMLRAEKRHLNKWIDWENKFIWIDMCKIFTEEPIVVKGSFNFKLKDISNAMKKNNLINIEWPKNGPSNGFTAMCNAIDYYNKKTNDKSIMNSIELYNEIDCKAIYEIVKYLRKYNC